MHTLNPYILLPLFLASYAAAQGCLQCTTDACAAALVPTSGMASSAKSACASWLSVTVTPTVTVTSTSYVDPTSTSTTTVTMLTTAATTSTSTLGPKLKEQQRRQLSTNAGVIVPAVVPSPYAGPCDGPSAFFSACECLGATRSTVTAAPTTSTVMATTTGGVAISVSTTTNDMSPTDRSSSTPTGYLQVQPDGGPVDNFYLTAQNVSQGQSMAVPLLFTQNRDLATVFDINAASAALEGYGPDYIGTQMVSGGENAPQSNDNVYNAMFLLPHQYSVDAQLPIPHCSITSSRSQTLDCVEMVNDDTRHMLQYCPPKSTWSPPFNTYGFLVLDAIVNPGCAAVNMKFQDAS